MGTSNNVDVDENAVLQSQPQHREHDHDRDNAAKADKSSPSSFHRLLALSVDIHGEDNFPQGCQFSPDGLCVLTSTTATLRLYNTIMVGPKNQEQVGDASSTTTNKVVVPWKTALTSRAVGDVVRCTDWYPKMNSNNAASCCFAAVGRDQPVHLVDAYTGCVRASYVPYNDKDEPESPRVIQFAPSGSQILTAGFQTDRMIQVFDIERPGKSCMVDTYSKSNKNNNNSDHSTTAIWKLGKTRRSSDGQKGLLSAVAFGGGDHLLAVGTYAPGSIYVYDYRHARTWHRPAGTVLNNCHRVVGHGKKHSGNKKRKCYDNNDQKLHVLEEGEEEKELNEDIFSLARSRWFAQRAQRGITQLTFGQGDNHSDYLLYSASRHSDAVLVWDLRVMSGKEGYQAQPVRGLSSFAANMHTNQRVQFALDCRQNRLVVGGCDPCIRVYDTVSGALLETMPVPECVQTGDAVNGVSYISTYDMLAVATGSRRFPTDEDYRTDDDNNSKDEVMIGGQEKLMQPPGTLQLFQLRSYPSKAFEL